MGHGLTWTDDEVDKLFDLVDDIKPHKPTGWEKVAERLGVAVGQKARTGGAVRSKFLQMKRRYMMSAKEYPSGETELPPLLKKVGEIAKALENSIPPEDVDGDVLNPDRMETEDSVRVRSFVADAEHPVIDMRVVDGKSETTLVTQRRQVDESVSHSVKSTHDVSKDQASCVSITNGIAPRDEIAGKANGTASHKKAGKSKGQMQHTLGGINNVDIPSDSSDSILSKTAVKSKRKVVQKQATPTSRIFIGQRKRAKVSNINGGTPFNEAVEADRMSKRNEKLKGNSELAIAREEAQKRHDEMMLRIEEMRAQQAEKEIRLEQAKMKHNEIMEKRRAEEDEKRREERREERIREREERDERAKQFMIFMSKLFDSKN